ncbi:MAG: HAMP domain-containing protein [Firmicutes bacterium]|nr:HAMP domain-containing protein [Bacillota bacterium]
MKRQSSLQVQIISRTLLILAVLLALIGLLQYYLMRDVIYQNKASSLQSEVRSIPPMVWSELDFGPGDGAVHPPRFIGHDTTIAFIDQNGGFSVLPGGPEGVETPQLDASEYLSLLQQPKKPGPNYRIVSAGGVEQLLVLQPIPAGPANGPADDMGVIQISTPTAPLKELMLRQLLLFLLLSFIAMVAGLVGFRPVIKKTLSPLLNMVGTAEQIDAGNLDRRFPTDQGQAEIDRLAESFNRMLGRLEASFEAERETQEQMRRFIADASHELRTPLTSIHGFLEVLLRGAANQPEQLEKALKSMHGESERLNKLVRDLILLAKLDRTPRVEIAEGRFDLLLREMEPQLHILAGKRRLDLKIEPGVKVRFDRDQMKQVVLNLFNNAVQHTDPEKGRIEVVLAKKDNGVVFSVEDNGPGISEDHLPHLFERFYRVESSRTRQYGGAGLGLSITRSIVEAHGGVISVDSQLGTRTVFEVRLPA